MQKMRIVIHCGGMPFNGDTIKTSSLGGSETAAWAMGRELAALGHDVTVFSNGDPGNFDGVQYFNIGKMTEQHPLGEIFEGYASAVDHDVLVIQRHPAAFVKRFNSKLNVWWTHDLGLKRYAHLIAAMAWNFDLALTVSEWHKKQMSGVYGLDTDTIMATTNGIYPEDFPERKHVEAGTLLYSSRPERGLVHLVRPGGIMDRLGDGFKLRVCCYDNSTPQTAQMYAQLYQWCADRPNVEMVGHLTQADLYKLMSETWLHCYPTEFEETSCITAMETQAAGLPIITSEKGALPETLRKAGAMLLPLKDGAADEDAFVEKIRWLADDPQGQVKYGKMLARCDAERYHWKLPALQWSERFGQMIEAKACNTEALKKHFVRYSDIIAYHKLTGEYPDGYEWAATAEGALEQNKRHHDYLYSNPNFPYFAATMKEHPRFRAVAMRLNDLPAGSVVFDAGPAEGCITLSLAEAFPQFTFVCVEPETRNIEFMRKKAIELGLTNVQIFEGHTGAIPDELAAILPEVKAVFLGEILEHLVDPVAFMRDLKGLLGGADGVRWVVTVPFGMSDQSPNNIAKINHIPVHLSHFEPADLGDIFGDFSRFTIDAIPTVTTHEGREGHSVVSFVTDADKDFGDIDYDRKLRMQAPRETLSVCMIAGHAEDTIGRALKSVKGIADEIIVAIDETSTDATEEIARRLGAKIVSIPSPLEIGFGAARNISIGHASGDWIMWIDSDEELLGANGLLKYLRPSPVKGLAIKQHHMGAQVGKDRQPGLLETDMPCRVFRNHEGVQFFGHVHEHPHKKLNEGVGRTLVVNDPVIWHPAYTTDEVRQRRFERNWPLMLRTLKELPDSWLHKALMVRDAALIVSGIIKPGTFIGEGVTREWLVDTARQYFADILDTGNTRLLMQSLRYYNALNEAMGEGIAWRFDVYPASLGNVIEDHANVIRGRFIDAEEAKRVRDLLCDEMVAPITGEYV